MAPPSSAPGSYFESLQLRPPTPPRETERIVAEACDFLSDSFEVSDATARPPLHNEPVVTPLKVAPPSVDSAVTSSGRPKKVGFSPWTDYHRPEDFLSRRGSISSPLRPLPQPKDHTTLKGILKARPPNANLDSAPSQSAPKFDTFAEMLDSLVKQLAGASRSHRRDAYVTLVSTLKAYDHFPEAHALVEKMGLLSQFIQRDIAIPTAANDAQLAQQALKLLGVLMDLSDVARHIPTELQVAFVSCAVQAFGDEKVLKRLVNPFLVLFSLQNFGPKVITPALVDQVVTHIQNIEERVSGQSVLAARLGVYQKLLGQAPDVMITRANDWLPHVLNSMVRTAPLELRRKALEVGHSAAIHIGDKPKVSRLVMELMDKKLGNGQTFGRDYVQSLQTMSKDPNSVEDVPKVWAVMILFLRGRHRELHQWKLFLEWFKIIQQCLNSSNREVVANANAAWNRFIYAIRPDTATNPATRILLRQGVALQLDRKAASVNERSMGSAFSSYCALLYYSLPPMASEEQLDLYWEEYVAQVLLEKMIKKSQAGANRACQVLTELFKGNKTGIWNENLVLQGLVTPGHLPGLDSKWVRRKLSVMLQLVQPCLSNAAWDSPSAGRPALSEPSVRNMWLALMSTVAEAGSKEITTSMEFKAASAHIMNFLHRIWNNFPASLGLADDEDEEWIERFSFLVTTAVQTLGPLHFADPILTQISPDNFEPVPTPSSRTKKKAVMQSPLLHLLHMFVCSENSPLVLDLSKRLITLASDSRGLRRSRLELLQNCAQEATASAEIAVRKELSTGIWIHVASLAKSTLKDPSGQPKSTSGSPRLGEEYRSALSILTCGLQFGGTETVAMAEELYNVLVTQVNVEAGNGAPSIAVTEPLAESIVTASENPTLDRPTIIGLATLALTQITPPRDRKSLDTARKALWGVCDGPQKPSVFDPYNHLYRMVVSQLHFAYENLDKLHPQLVIDFVSSLAALLQRWPASNTAIMLRKIQEGIALWVEDRDKKLEGEGEDSKAGKRAVDSFWTVVMVVVVQLPRKDTMLLKALEHLIASGLNSRQRCVVNRTVENWNRSFGKERTLEYPPKVEKALRRLRPYLGVELELPNFPSGPADENLGPAPAFEESQGSAPVTRASSRLAAPPTAPVLSSKTSKQKSVKPIPKAKLRHDDSQIDYTAIESSQGQDVSVDSQLLLTEHQKEVREKQHGSAAVMFPDINSSPAHMSKRSRSEAIKQTELPLDLPGEGDGSRLSTPVLAALGSDGLQDLGGSSPTARFRSERDDPPLDQNYITSSAADRFFETEIPSSPPRMDDDNDLPPDSSVVKESFARLSQESAGSRPSASGLSQDSPISILTGSFGSLDSDGDESARQLADESQARQSFKLNEPAAVESDPAVEDEHLKTEESEGNTDNINGFDSFSDVADGLPQGTAEATSSLVPARIAVDDMSDQESTEVLSTPAGVRSQSPAQVQKGIEIAQSQDDSVVQDSFALSEVNNGLADKEDAVQQDREGPPTTGNQRKRAAKKRKNQAVEEGPTKRIKHSSRDQGDEDSSPVSIASGQGKEGQDGGSVDEDKTSKTNLRKSSSSAQAQPLVQHDLRHERPKPSPSQVQFGDESTKSLPAESQVESSPASNASDSRASPRSAGKAPQEPLPFFRKRKSRLSESQAIDDDQEMNQEESDYGNTSIDLDVVHETPAPKKRRGRPPKNRVSNASETSQSTASPQETTNASGTGPTRGRGRPRKNSLQARWSQSQQKHGRSDDIDKTAAAEARSTKSSQQKSDNAGAGDGGTTATTTGSSSSSSRAESQHDATAASQASQASDGRRKKEPRSILGRLKQLLADAKSMVVGREEERDCCDVMFELQREVHEAARRGEAQGQ